MKHKKLTSIQNNINLYLWSQLDLSLSSHARYSLLGSSLHSTLWKQLRSPLSDSLRWSLWENTRNQLFDWSSKKIELTIVGDHIQYDDRKRDFRQNFR